MAISNQLKNQHLLWRVGFGPGSQPAEAWSSESQRSLYTALEKASSKTPEYIEVADNMLNGLVMGVGEVLNMQKNELSADQKKQLRKQSQRDIKNLNLAWINEMVNSEAQLREKIALFWHGHFASRNLNIFYQQLLLDVIRKNALGNFSDLLFGVSKSAAMLNFLNNNQNKKDHPNENFAREVMELFTLGRGNYTELDVKEGARAFTGWGANLQGEFVLRRFQHDDGSKTFLGKTGNFNGDDILSILVEQKQTAFHISAKLYRYLVNDELDPARASWLGERFYQSNYDIQGLLRDIFWSDWFYQDQHIASRIKSPVDLLVGIRRTLPLKIENEEAQLLVQRVLGQLLFYPPNVAGWPGGTNWIDSSSLMFRLRIPQLISEADEFQMRPKDDDDQQMGMKAKEENTNASTNPEKVKNGQMIKAEINWTEYQKKFDKVSRQDLFSTISRSLLQTKGPDEQMLGNYLDLGSREGFIKTCSIQLMSTPEYQLC